MVVGSTRLVVPLSAWWEAGTRLVVYQPWEESGSTRLVVYQPWEKEAVCASCLPPTLGRMEETMRLMPPSHPREKEGCMRLMPP